MKIGNSFFDTEKKSYIMGILNVTPDSFSDGGKWNDRDKALRHVEQMINEGMDILDVGGESTRPGYVRISESEEIERVCPIIQNIKSQFDIPVSLDTYKPEVAVEGIKAGADLINDIWGLKYDDRMGKVISDFGVACCLMHNKEKAEYSDFEKNLISELKESIDLAINAGIGKDRIILDPGVGFAKDVSENLKCISSIDEIKALGFPVLLGCSRKSVIGKVLDLPVDDRLEGTLATTAIGVLKGAAFIRVHDIKENRRAVDMALAIRNS
ncbi:MAG: dihydropteroate synthase [Acetatifactor sp.]|nr:dihydropteroate synthase [Acetatifactor sp.]